ncbi:MAG: efflux RND transporter periplasmic adaptor subunit [Elusimicrobium sp.]|uniref:Efflux RND transporter periplasmic adaptor subunit n=1 Tax=Candidatus Avelusimicrobium gallicola TaxID=2562704 RepID=A0A928HFL1_9BACT|nr:efflux RND transporter periplasmic adaptor subunit [Elusimicrobium sp.]
MCKKIVALGCVAVGLAIFFSAGCKKKNADATAPVSVVNAVTVLQQDLPWTIEYPAQVAGSLDIQIRAQVGGILEARLYNEGEYVEAGTQLFQIDDKEYKVALEKAQGTLAQAIAQEKQTKRTYTRMKSLRADNAISQQDYDNALSAYEAAQANVKVAKAGVSNAEINLGYTKVTAPISGIAGKESQSVGSLVSAAGETGLLTTMVQINPLYVNFSMPSRQFEQLAAGFMSGQITIGTEEQRKSLSAENYRKVGAEDAPIYVEAVLANGRVYPEKGKIVFFDSTENTQTSSLAIKAEFPNPKNSRLLMPGQFVRVHLVGATYKNAILIPSSAVLNTQNGMISYVIDENDSLVARPIQAHLQDDMYIVTDGLKAGERVVSGGLAKVRPGQQVQVQMKEFSVSAEKEEVQPAQEDGRSVAELEKVIENAEAPDTQAVPNEAAQEAVPAAQETAPATK